MNEEDYINYFAETNFRNARKKFGIRLDDRRKHVYIIGKTGMGKTTLLANLAIQDIKNGYGLAFVDPHGEQAEELLEHIPKERAGDVIYFNPSDIDWPIGFNIMEIKDPNTRHLIAAGLMGVFKKIWPDVWSARMEYILNNCILALLEFPGSTLLGINRMLADLDYRKKVIKYIVDPVIKSFWTQEFARYSQRYEVEATAAIQNKVGQFASNPLIRNIIGQLRSTIDMREIMDSKKILIVNLSKGKVGEANSMLLGNLIITKLYLAAMSRVEVFEKERKDFFLYVDEFQNFATESFASILSEARKYRLSLTLAHQYIAQMEEVVRDAVFGNAGTIISFRIGAEDSEYLEKEFAPVLTAEDLVNLPKYEIYLKLMVDGVAGRPFSAATLAPFIRPEEISKEIIIKRTREHYAIPKAEVEKQISDWAQIENIPPQKARPVNNNNNKSNQKSNFAIPFKKAIEKEPVFFSPSRKNREKPAKEKKKPDIGGLKKAINNALGENKREEKEYEKQEGVLKPGQRISFE
jgi:hypothetical protein